MAKLRTSKLGYCILQLSWRTGTHPALEKHLPGHESSGDTARYLNDAVEAYEGREDEIKMLLERLLQRGVPSHEALSEAEASSERIPIKLLAELVRANQV